MTLAGVTAGSSLLKQAPVLAAWALSPHHENVHLNTEALLCLVS